MSYRRVWTTGGGWRALAALAFALAAVTCRDAVGPHGTGAGQGRVVFAPVLPSEAALASFGLVIDQVRIIVVRPAADTLADTTVALPPDSSALDLDLHVALLASPETLSVSIIALAGSQALFTGTSDVEVTSESETPAPTEIPIDTYVGPGAGVDSIAISPALPFIYVNDSLRFQVAAFQGGLPVTQFYVAWSSSDTTIARINGYGVLRAPGTRSSVRVRARTPSGVSDSVTATFQPIPSQLTLIAGGSQSGIVGQPLAVPLQVEVRAADNLPVGGIAVRFRAPAGGAPADTTVTADSLGHASVNPVLGSGVGPQTFQITLPAFPAVPTLNVGATATSGAIAPTQSIITVSNDSVASGNTVTLTLQGKDGGGNSVTSGGATVVFSVTGGTSTGTIAPSPATDNGNGTYTATFTGVIAGTAATVGATIDAAPVTTTPPTLTVTPGAISPATSIVSVSNDSVGSGGTATLTLQARDAAGNALTTGGATVAFTVSGGTSGGTVGATTDHGNGTYSAVFTAVTAGTPATIGATIGASPVTSALPTITVTAGAASPATSILSASSGTVASGSFVTLRVQAKDASGNNLTAGGAAVAFSHTGGTSTGAIGATADSGNGVYTATFTGVLAGSATTIGATINSAPITSGSPTVAVTPGGISGATSVLTVSTDSLASGAVATLRLVAKDAAGNGLAAGGDTVVFTAAGGGSTGAIGATADSGNGVYTAGFTGLAAGTATTIQATVNGAAVTSALPSIAVRPGATSQLVFTVQPSPSFIGTPIAPAVEATARDAFGNTTPAFVDSVTVAIGTNPGTGTLTGTVSRGAVAGVATFNDLQIDQPGIGYTLTASASGLTSATSATFDMLTAAGTIAWANAAGGNWSNPVNWNGGVVPGPTDIALITLPGTYTITFDVSDTVGGLQLGGSSGTQTLALSSRTLGLAAGSQVNANGVVSMQSSTLDGPGSVTNLGQVTARSSTINAGWINQGTLFAEGSTALNGAVSTGPASLIRAQGNNVVGTANLTIAGGFTNNGTIALSDSAGAFGAGLRVTSGTLINAGGALIDSRVGANGTRNLDAPLDNQGTLTVTQPLSLTKVSAVHSNSGTINVNAKLTIQQSGVGPSFTNTGSIPIATGDTVVVTGGTFAYSGGSISGGALNIASATVNSAQSFSTATTALKLATVTWGGTGTLTIAPSTVLTMGSTTITSGLVNQGTLTVTGTSNLNGAVTNAAGASLRVQGNNSLGTGNLTVANGFTNDGTIVLTDTLGGFGAVFAVTAGALDNAAGGTILSDVGAGGTRSLNATLNNQGTLTIDHALTLNKASAAHTNAGTIGVGAKFTILQTGTSPTFTNTAAINIGSGDTVAVSGGGFAYAGGAIAGPGAITFSSGSLTLTQSLSTATVPFSLTSVTVAGTGTLTVDPGTSLLVKSSTINAPLTNQGQLDVHGSNTFNGALSNISGATLRLVGDNALGTATLAVGSSFTNNGTIVLTDTLGAFGAVLNMPAATLTNAVGATIDAALGAGGTRTLGVELNNQGTVTLARAMTINRASAAHTNSGTIDVSGGDLTLQQGGTTPSFTTSGTITIAAGRTFQVNSGTLNYTAGTIGGSGTLAISGATVAASQDFSTATTALTLTSATWGGSGKLTVAAATALNVKSSTINSRLVNQGALDVHGTSAFNDSVTNASAATLRLVGDNSLGTANVTALNGFTNDGTMVLTDTLGAFGAVLHVTNGTLTNAPGATIRADTGAGGTRTLDAQLDNEGSVAVRGPTTLTKSSGAHVNRGTMDVNGGNLTISQSGTTPSFTQLGTITINSVDSVVVLSGSFTYDSGTISGGALRFSGVAVSAARDFSTATTALRLASTTWSGTGILTVAPSTVFVPQGSTINAPFVNQGTVLFAGTNTFNGTVANAAGATMHVQGNGAVGTGTLTVANGFTNNGTIALTDTSGAFSAILNVNSGTLVNATGGIIRADTGAGGARTFNALLDNRGTFIAATGAAQTTTINKVSGAHTNSGTWTIASGTTTIQGTGASFTNATGGTVQGAGVFKVTGITFTNDGAINPGTAGTGILAIIGDYAQGAAGALNIELGGTTVGSQYDRLADSAGTVSLNGALNVTLVNGFTPALGDTFTVLTFPSRAGTIPTLNGLIIGGGVQLDTVWTPTSLRLVAIVLQTTHAADITTNETWSAINSPHIVSGYLKIVNGATLTIEDGTTVKFDAGTGLQVGDSVAGAGGLVMLGTPGSIHLTANTGSPVPGFWKGVEVQKASGPLAWRNVEIEYAGGTRPNLIDESCILLVDPAATIDLDSVRIRQCIHAGVHHAAGNVHVHRSEIDSVTGAGIQSFAGVLRLDSTAIRGSGQLGLIFGNGSVDLAGAVGNTFVDNAGGSVQMFGHQLPGFGRQAAIGGNGLGGVGDTIVVDSGTVGTDVPAFTIFRQPAPYLVTGFLNVWSASGVTVTLDTGLVMAFDTAAALSVGDFADAAGTSSGMSATFVSLGTAANPVVLRSRLGRPGWGGLYLGSQSGTSVVRHLRLVGGGYITQGAFCGNCLVRTIGFAEPLNANLWVDAPLGTAPFVIDSVFSDSSGYIGLAIKRTPPEGMRLFNSTIQNASFTGLAVRAAYNPKDSIIGNTIVGNEYPVDIVPEALPALGINAVGGNVRDTLLLRGGALVAPDTLPQLGPTWRVLNHVVVDSGAVLWVLAGDTVVFDDSVGLTIGGVSPSAIRALGTSTAPILFTVTPGQTQWDGLVFANLSGIANLANSTVRNVIIEHAGNSIPCFGDCNATPVAGVRYANVSSNALTLDSVTIRQSVTIALDVDSAAGSPLTVQFSQFYQNPFSPMIRSRNPTLLAIHGSDLYHYNAQIIQTANAGTDSIAAEDNWWGDVGGLARGFEFQDSLGRGSLWFNAVRFTPFQVTPRFAVGAAAQIVAARDTVLNSGFGLNAVVGDPDSIRARVLDAQGRGVANYDVQWGTSTGSLSFLTSLTDVGGRVGGVWTTGTLAGLHFVQATGPGLTGSPVTWSTTLQPDLTVSTNWQLIPSLTQGTVSTGLDTASFTSSNRSSALVSNAVDQYGNRTSPTSGFFFTDVPNSGFQPYGVVDSIHGDTVFFHISVSNPAIYQVHGLYDGGLFQDSLFITVSAAAAGIRIAQDTATFIATCPADPANSFCERPFWAEVVDSAGAPLPPSAAYQFNWTPDPAGLITIRRTAGVANDTVIVTARANGATWITVDEVLAGLVPSHDSLPLTIQQITASVLVQPDTISARIGDALIFRGTPRDLGGTPTADTIHWAADFPGTLTFLDTTSVFNQATVRLDSTSFGTANVLTYVNGSLLGFAQVYNPVQALIPGVGTETNGVLVNAGLVYVATDTGVAMIDQSDAVATFIRIPEPTYYLAHDRTRNVIYAGARFSGTMYVIDGFTNALQRNFQVNPLFVPQFAVDESNGQLLVPTVVCVGTPACVDVDFLGVFDPADGTLVDTIPIGDQGVALAFDQATRTAYAGVFAGPRDSIKVIDLAQRKAVDSIEVGSSLANLAFNPVTRLLYASDYVDNDVYVIDAGTRTVRNLVAVGVAPEGIAIDTIRNRIYVANTSDPTIYVIDGATDQIIQFISVPAPTSQAAVWQGGNQLYVNTYGGRDVRILKF